MKTEQTTYEYKTECTYPDLLDLERVLRHMDENSVLKKKYDASTLFQDFAATFDWMHCILPRLHFHGKHSFESVIDVKAIVEKFVRRTIKEDSFLAACHERGLPIKKASGSRGHFFCDLEIKVPSMDRATEFLTLWNEYIKGKN
jgi:hypothetical protein